MFISDKEPETVLRAEENEQSPSCVVSKDTQVPRGQDVSRSAAAELGEQKGRGSGRLPAMRA